MTIGPFAAMLATLALQTPAGAPPDGSVPHWPAVTEAPGGAWACDPGHERERQADLALTRADTPKGLKGAAPDLPQLEAALAHAPTQPIGGLATCDGRRIAFNSPASLGALLAAANRHEQVTIDSRPMPYADLALLVGSLHDEAGRYDRALAALDRGLAVEPMNPLLVSEKAYAFNRTGRSAEAAALCAQAIAVDPGVDKVQLARLHRTRGYALGELGRYDEAIADYRASQGLDPAETASANELVYLQRRKAGLPGGGAPVRSFTTDQLRKPPS